MAEVAAPAAAVEAAAAAAAATTATTTAEETNAKKGAEEAAAAAAATTATTTAVEDAAKTAKAAKAAVKRAQAVTVAAENAVEKAAEAAGRAETAVTEAKTAEDAAKAAEAAGTALNLAKTALQRAEAAAEKAKEIAIQNDEVDKIITRAKTALQTAQAAVTRAQAVTLEAENAEKEREKREKAAANKEKITINIKRAKELFGIEEDSNQESKSPKNLWETITNKVKSNKSKNGLNKVIEDLESIYNNDVEEEKIEEQIQSFTNQIDNFTAMENEIHNTENPNPPTLIQSKVIRLINNIKNIAFENLFSKIKEIFLAANDLDILSLFNLKDKAEDSWPNITHKNFDEIETQIENEELKEMVEETKNLFPENTTANEVNTNEVNTNVGNKHMVGGGAKYNKALMEQMVNRIQPKLNYVFDIWKGGGNASVNLLLTGLSGVGKSFLVFGTENGRIDYEDDNNTQNYTHGLLYEIIKEIQKLVKTEDTTEDTTKGTKDTKGTKGTKGTKDTKGTKGTTKATHESNVTMQMIITLYSAFHGKKDSTGDCGIPVKLENENIDLSGNIEDIIPKIKNNLMKYEKINIKMNTINRAKKFGENIEEMGKKLDYEILKNKPSFNRTRQIVPYILESRTKTIKKIKNIESKKSELTEEERRISDPTQRTMEGETLKDIAENNKGNEKSSRLQTVIELIITNPKINNKLRILIIDPAGTEHLAGEMPLIHSSGEKESGEEESGEEESVDGNLNDYNKLEQNELTSYLVNKNKLMLASAIESHFINISLFYLNLLFLNQNMFDFYNYHDRIDRIAIKKNYQNLVNFHYNIMPFSEFIYGIEEREVEVEKEEKEEREVKEEKETIYTGKTTINIHNTNEEKYYCLQSGYSNSKKGNINSKNNTKKKDQLDDINNIWEEIYKNNINNDLPGSLDKDMPFHFVKEIRRKMKYVKETKETKKWANYNIVCNILDGSGNINKTFFEKRFKKIIAMKQENEKIKFGEKKRYYSPPKIESLIDLFRAGLHHPNATVNSPNANSPNRIGRNRGRLLVQNWTIGGNKKTKRKKKKNKKKTRKKLRI